MNKKKGRYIDVIRTLLAVVISLLFYQQVLGACGATTITWEADAGTSTWDDTNNWNPNNIPNANGENVVIVSDWFNPDWPASNYNMSCFEIQSGTMTATNDQRVTIRGDYFRNLNPGSLILGPANIWEVLMRGTADQTFENVDLIPRLRVNNANTVRLTESFSIRDRFRLTAGAGFVVIEKELTTLQTNAVNIPAGASVTVASGGTWNLNGNLTVDGTLVLEPGAKLSFADGRRLDIRVGGIADINGAAGNAVTITSENASSTFLMRVNGTLDAQYLVLNYLNGTGVEVNTTLSRFDNVTINSIASGGAAMTIGASASMPSTLNSVGFFEDGGAGPFTNVDGSLYSGSAVSFSNWSGIGDTANENDPNTIINWGTEATPVLQIQNISGAGVPPTSIVKGSALTEFATLAFSMSGTAATATNVTALTMTLDGSNLNSDVSNIGVYNDTNGNCAYDNGTDLLIGNYTPSGTPGTIDVSMSGEISVIDTTQDCLHVLMTTNAAATTSNTIGVSVESTDDITNDQGYALSDTSGPPVRPGVASITGAAVARWNGGFSTNMATTGNWTPNTTPTSTIDCEIGNGYQAPQMGAAFDCLNTKFQSSGSIDWNNTANIFNVYGALTVESGFTYTNSNNGTINIRGAADQSVTLNGTTFPNDFTINSGGTVTFEDNGVITGNLSLTSGNVTIASGANLQVTGNVTVATGTTFDIEPGGTLVLGNGSSLTVNSGGFLEMVGTAVQSSAVRAVNDASNQTITVNNGATIRARYYSLRNLGTTGLTVNAIATIDGTNFLQNGTFAYPGASNSDMLRLFQEIPGDVLDGMSFDTDGSVATGVMSILTNTGATADSLNMSNYAGDMTGLTFTDATNYLVTWGTPTNELKLTQESTAPASSNQGDVVDMGSFGLQQLNAGAFNDTDITYIRITLTGTGSSSDVDSVTLYYDSACSGSGGTSLGTKTFSGNPARAEFMSITGATVEAHATTPPLRCINVQYNINALATDSKTVGAQITSSTHVTNSEAFAFNAGFAPAVNLGTTSIVGTTTLWTGNTDTDWFTAGNWSSGVPNSGLNCVINNEANDPTIGAGTATCKSMSIGNGILTHNGGSLELYGSLESTGTINSSAPIVIRDDGVVQTSQSIDTSSVLDEVQFNKTAGGSVNINSSVQVTTAMNINGSQDFTLNISNNNSLILPGGLTLSGAVIDMAGGSELQIGSGQSLTVNGGTFRTSGTNDAFPQSTSNKATLTNTGGTGTWSFSASSGTVDLTGFLIDWLDTSGLNFSGSVNLSSLSGGQLRNLPSSASMRALQFNTSGSIPATASNFGWNWGPTNSPPAEGTAYFLGFSSGCGSQTIDFDQWFGDFWPYTTASTSDKISAASCTILIDRAKSPVSLTRLEATPYDSKVVLEWTTGNEWNHRGFNVYRSLNPEDSFVQINEELIRNDLFSTNIHGTYAFVDEGVSNETTYYYMIEDLSLMGESVLHGPLTATPKASLGNPPAIEAGTIATNSDQEGGGVSDASGGDTLEISENVWVLAQTENYMRIKIVVPLLSQNPDPLNGSYQKLSIDGFSPSTVPGSPELLNKTVMIPLSSEDSSAVWESVSEAVSSFTGVSVTPAPEYIAAGNTMVANWILDSVVYGQNQDSTSDFIELGSAVHLNNKSYLPLVIHGVKYNPVTQGLTKANELVFDLHLQGQAPWASIDTSRTPWMREGSVKLGMLEEGMHKVSYTDLENAGVVAPLKGKSIAEIHLMIASAPIGIDIESTDGLFNSGDSISFYAPKLRSDEDLHTYAILYWDDSIASLQANSVDATITSEPLTSKAGFWTKRLYEENNIAIFNEPFTENADHFVWSMIYGVSGGANSPLSFDIELPNLSDSGQVTIGVHVKSRTANSVNTLHNLELYINEQVYFVAEQSFQAVEAKTIRFSVPTSQFVAGKNKISLVATGDNLTAGEYDMLYVDRVETYFHQDWTVDNDEALILDQSQGYSYNVDGFSGSDILVYDVSSPSQLGLLSNTVIGAGAQGQEVQFALNGNSSGRRLWVGRSGSKKSVSSYKLISGSHWKNSNLRADIVFVGHKDLIDIAKKLGDLRESQGHKVQYVELESLYNEFGNGLHNVSAVKAFVEATRLWQKAPQYFILLGDGTYDPKAYQNGVVKYRFPVKFIKGSSYDYVSDHWFVANDSGIPQEIVARIPAQTKGDLESYIQKVLDYEKGTRAPNRQDSMSLISDKPLYQGEDFETPVDDIQSLFEVQSILNPRSHIKRSQMTDTELKQAIENSFDSSSVVHYMGHGAENMWADASVFDNSDVAALTNSKLPVVVAMNCLNAQYSDPSLDSFAEKMIFNPKGGAIVFWGSTSLTPPSLQKVYQESFYKNMGQSQDSDLGNLVQMAKVEAGLSSPFDEILYSWTIIGDPLVKPALSFQKAEARAPAPVEQPVFVAPSAGGGCSANASIGAKSNGTPWDIVFSFLIEVLLSLAFIRGFRKAVALSKYP